MFAPLRWESLSANISHNCLSSARKNVKFANINCASSIPSEIFLSVIWLQLIAYSLYRLVTFWGIQAYRKVERQVKVIIKNLAIFFLFPSKQFLPISLKIYNSNIMQYLNHEYLKKKHISSTRKGFEECVRGETGRLATLKSKKYKSW